MTVSARARTFTILGANGFVGAALAAWLESNDYLVHPITRASLPALLATHRSAGHVIDCIGLTGDFRSRPLDTADPHIGIAARCLAELEFDSFLLLSSTRVYARAAATHENALIPCQPDERSDLYNITKLAGEALCLTDPRPSVRVVRLSNVYSSNLPAESFLGQVLREGHCTGHVLLRDSGASAKDYINLSEVVRHLPAICRSGRARLYNVAAGCNTSHATIAARLRQLMGWRVEFAPDAPTICNLPIDTSRLGAEFGPALSKLSADLPTLLGLGEEVQCSPSMKHVAA